MSNVIYKFNSPWDVNTLLNEWDQSTSETFSQLNTQWEKTFEVGAYGEDIKNDFPNVAVGYYFQPAGSQILPHKDGKCECRINIVLSGADEVLHINGEEHVYDCALINTSQYEHYVNTASENRLLFSIIFPTTPFEEALSLVKSHIEN